MLLDKIDFSRGPIMLAVQEGFAFFQHKTTTVRTKAHCEFEINGFSYKLALEHGSAILESDNQFCKTKSSDLSLVEWKRCKIIQQEEPTRNLHRFQRGGRRKESKMKKCG